MAKKLVQVIVSFKSGNQCSPTVIEIVTSSVTFSSKDLGGKRRWTDMQLAKSALEYYSRDKGIGDLQVKDIMVERTYERTTVTKEVKRTFL